MLQYRILIGYTIIISYLFWPHFNAYGSVNGFFIYITDTEQKQIQPCCNSTIESQEHVLFEAANRVQLPRLLQNYILYGMSLFDETDDSEEFES